MPLRGDAAPDNPTYLEPEPIQGVWNAKIERSYHKGFGCWVIQKSILVGDQPTAIAFAEPRLLRSIDHPHIVKVLESQPDPENAGYITMVMPFYQRGSLADSLSSGHRYSIKAALQINCDALSGLAHLHTEVGNTGYVDRDYKPPNILLSDNGRHGLLSDLGSAAKIEADGTVPTGLFTLPYLAPEGFGAGARLTRRSDVYAAGLTLMETLNGWPPSWLGLDPNNIAARLAQRRRGLPDSRLVLAPHVTGRLRRYINRAIHANPMKRPADALDFLKQLRSVDGIDWRQTEYVGTTEGSWEGTYTPRRRGISKRWFQVTTAEKGGRLIAVARQRVTATGPWRRFGLEDLTFTRGDVPALSHLFAAIEDDAAQ